MSIDNSDDNLRNNQIAKVVTGTDPTERNVHIWQWEYHTDHQYWHHHVKVDDFQGYIYRCIERDGKWYWGCASYDNEWGTLTPETRWSEPFLSLEAAQEDAHNYDIWHRNVAPTL